jgi:hypothetical protein
LWLIDVKADQRVGGRSNTETSAGSRAFASEGLRHRTPDRTGRPVDDRVLVFQQHDVSPFRRRAAVVFSDLAF